MSAEWQAGLHGPHYFLSLGQRISLAPMHLAQMLINEHRKLRFLPSAPWSSNHQRAKVAEPKAAAKKANEWATRKRVRSAKALESQRAIESTASRRWGAYLGAWCSARHGVKSQTMVRGALQWRRYSLEPGCGCVQQALLRTLVRAREGQALQVKVRLLGLCLVLHSELGGGSCSAWPGAWLATSEANWAHM